MLAERQPTNESTMRATPGSGALPTQPSGSAIYAHVKVWILQRIRAGEWPPRHRIPSEHQLVAELGLSRMTVHRALRELAQEGALYRVQGLGTFVAQPKVQSSVFEIRNIADEIAERGHAHAAKVVVLDEIKASPEVADALQLPIGGPVYYSLIVHTENEMPVQLEERHVNPALAPDYLTQDFVATTPNGYLSAVAPWTDAEHEIEAVLPENWEAKLLAVARGEPCLLIKRRTWLAPQAVTTVRLLMPSSRFGIKSRQRAGTVSFGGQPT